MADNTAIEWTNATWNPIRSRRRDGTAHVGWHCEHASPGCVNCFAERINVGGWPPKVGTGLSYKPGHLEDVEVYLDEDVLLQPLRWRKPRMIFPCSMTDMFGRFVRDDMLDRMFAVMALAKQHTFQVLTKRSDRMREWVSRAVGLAQAAQFGGTVVADELPFLTGAIAHPAGPRNFPLPNVWLGVSVEDQARADERIPDLLNTPAAVHFVSCEPLLGPVNFRSIGLPDDPNASCFDLQLDALTGFHSGICHPGGRQGVYSLPRRLAGLDWIIVGGESGPNARPIHPDWARSLRDQCQAAFVPFFFKQWGEWAPGAANCGEPGDGLLAKVGKKRAGRLLDGREWSEFPA